MRRRPPVPVVYPDSFVGHRHTLDDDRRGRSGATEKDKDDFEARGGRRERFSRKRVRFVDEHGNDLPPSPVSPPSPPPPPPPPPPSPGPLFQEEGYRSLPRSSLKRRAKQRRAFPAVAEDAQQRVVERNNHHMSLKTMLSREPPQATAEEAAAAAAAATAAFPPARIIFSRREPGNVHEARELEARLRQQLHRGGSRALQQQWRQQRESGQSASYFTRFIWAETYRCIRESHGRH